MSSPEHRNPASELSRDLLDRWVNDAQGPVALTLRQRLRPVEDGEHPVIFPPTYADIGYNIDTLSDGTKVATIDSIGSQANRMEPIFKSIGNDEKGKELNPLANLVPQIEIEVNRGARVSLLDLAHRITDATVLASPELAKLVLPAIEALDKEGDAGPLCCLAPTSLVFGFWNSRAKPAVKRPRLIRSVIRAWDIEPLYAAAQFNSVWKSLDDEQKAELEKHAKTNKGKLSEVGFADAPATFRKVSTGAAKHMTEFRGGSPNPERRVLGGVLVRGQIERTITLNLLALRALRGTLPDNGGGRRDASNQIRTYLLLLALLAATAGPELYLREGCLLRIDGSDDWGMVPRRGDKVTLEWGGPEITGNLCQWASSAAEEFRPHWLEHKPYAFDIKAAKHLIKQAESVEGTAT